MASISITIADNQIARIASALCKENNLTVSNANAKQALKDYIRRCMVSQETKTVVQNATAGLINDVNNISLT